MNELVIVSDEEDNENVDVNNVIQTLRNRLKKYLYYPNKQKTNDHDDLGAHPQHVIEVNGSSNVQQYCQKCEKLIKRHTNRRRQRRLCRTCRFLIRRNEKAQAKVIQQTHVSSSTDTYSNNRINIFEKLQQLGTSIYYENDSNGKQLNRTMTSIPHEIDTKKPTIAWKRTNESNEILMTFNTVVTEVFPIKQLYNQYDRQDDQIPNINTDETKLNIQEILRNVPKSLTITIA